MTTATLFIYGKNVKGKYTLLRKVEVQKNSMNFYKNNFVKAYFEKLAKELEPNCMKIWVQK